MAKKEKRLPRPPKTPFGRQRKFEGEEEGRVTLLADEMAKAIAEGNLTEFLQKEIPDSEHARKLVSMMMSMTGLLPSESFSEKGEDDEKTYPAQPPEDVCEAAQSGDVKGLMKLLSREHKKRMSDSGALPAAEPGQTSRLSSSEKEVLDSLGRIAAENNVSVDWLVMRALKLYIEGYLKTNRL